MDVIQLDEEAIFYVARRIEDREARDAYLGQVCGGDAALRDRVDALLQVSRQEVSFLEVPPYDATAETSIPAEGPGTTIGPYKLLEALGEGGMGVVFMAEQTQPVRRKVALKVIKPGLDTRQVIARFEAERQALALMDHPHIARVLDAGATESGRPYFVMELVRGVPITEYCDREKLPLKDRLDLFVLVCRAVQHAHQKGIIHRDLKPSNVLVTLHDGVAVPKVIDFGIAKATGQQLAEKTLFTAFAQLVGTPLYMSPEQAELSGLDVDTRSDIYSLGVLLYELLTGTTPFDSETLRKAAFDEVRRILREQEPPKPSTRLSTLGATLTAVSANRGSDPRRLGPSLRGELDWIVMKALEKDRRRRYETANGFAADVERHLADRPVEAGPPSAWYRLRKAARRNRAALTTAAVVAGALVGGTAVSAWQAIRARAAEAEARLQAEEKDLVVDYLVQDVFGAAARGRARGRTVSVQGLLTSGEEAIPARFARRPLAEAPARRALGEAYWGIGLTPEAERQFLRVAELLSRHLGPGHVDTLEAQARVVWIQLHGGPSPSKLREVESLGRRVLEARLRLLGPEHPQTLASMAQLGSALNRPGRSDEARHLLERALAGQRRVLGPEHLDTIETLYRLGKTLKSQGKLADAEVALRGVVELRRKVLGPAAHETLAGVFYLAEVLRAQRRLDEAIPLYREVVEGLVRLYGLASNQVSASLYTLMSALREKQDLATLRDLCQGRIAQLLGMPPEDDPHQRYRRSIRLSSLAFPLATLPESVPIDAALAVRAAEEAVALDPKWNSVRTILGAAYCRAGRPEAALEVVQASLKNRDTKPGPRSSLGDGGDWLVLAVAHARRGDRAGARAWYDRARTCDFSGSNWPEEIALLRAEAEGLINAKHP